MGRFIFFFLLASLSLIAKKKTNFVFFLVDDMGMMDLGTYGSTFHETPNIDNLAKTGMKFNYGYAACPVCSPTRASIMTGRHPVRVDITDWIPGQSNRPTNPLLHPEDRHSLPLEEVTLAEALKQHGYQTFFAGKWHLGKEGEWPTDQGFDINIGGHHKGSPPGGYYAPWTNPTLKAKRKGEYLTERLTEESAKFLESRDKAKPFLLYLSYYNIHTPIQPYKKRIDHYKSKAEKSFTGPTPFEVEHDGKTRTRQDNPALASMVAAVDDAADAVAAAVDEHLALAQPRAHPPQQSRREDNPRAAADPPLLSAAAVPRIHRLGGGRQRREVALEIRAVDRLCRAARALSVAPVGCAGGGQRRAVSVSSIRW